MKDVKELITMSSLRLGLLFMIFTAVDSLIFGWNDSTTIHASIAVISLLIFLALELYFAPEIDDDI